MKFRPLRHSAAGFVAALMLALPQLDANAAARFARASGAWNAAIWSATSCIAGALTASIPGAADDATICAGFTVTLDASRTVRTVIINGTLDISTLTLTIANTPAVTLNAGGALSGSGAGTILLNGDRATTLVTGTAAAVTFNNLTINPAITSNRTYTLAAVAGSIRGITVAGNFNVAPPFSGGSQLTVNVGALTTAGGGLVVAGAGGTSTLTLNAGGTDLLDFSTGGINMTLNKLVLGGAGTGANTFTMTNAAHTLTLSGTSGTLITRNTNGVFAAGTTGSVLVQPSTPADVQLNGGTGGTLTFNNLTVNNLGKTATLGAATIVNTTALVSAGTLSNGGFSLSGDGTGTFQVNDGATYAMTGASVFPASFTAANYIFQCTAYPSCSTVSYRQTTDPLTITNLANGYGHLELAPAGTATQRFAAGTYTINGDLIVGNGTNTTTADAATNSVVLDVNGGVSISANSTLTAHASNSFTVARNWTNAGTFTASGGTVTLDGGAAQTIGGTAGTAFHNLTSSNTAGGVSLTGGQTQTVTGTLTLGATTFAVGANSLTLNGPTIAGTPTNLTTTSSSNLTFGGTSAGVNLPSSVTNLNNLTLNNTNATPQLILNSGPTVAGTLTLTNGVIVAGTNTLTTSANCPGSVVRTSGWVSGDLRMAVPSAGPPNCTFHIGDSATNYTPLQVNFTSVTTPGNLTARVTNTEHPNTPATSGIDSTKSINRYWTLKDSTAAGTYTATFTYINGTPVDRDSGATAASFVIRRGAGCTGSGAGRSCSPWSGLTVSGTPGNTAASASGVTVIADSPAQADFVVGEPTGPTSFLRERQFIYTRELY